MSSPVLTLTDWVAASPFRIAPEKAPQLTGFLDQTKTILEINDRPGFLVNVTRERVRFSESALELLWTAAHAYCVLFDEYKKGFDRHETHFDVGAVPRARRAVELYDWALAKCQDGSSVQWPSADIVPIKDATALSDIHVANELFLTSTAWILLHEIAHLRLGHSAVTPASKKEEQDADFAATEWVLPPDNDAGTTTKRVLGVASAILALTALDLRARSFNSSTHPRSFERLLYCLDRTAIAEDHFVYMVVYVLLQIHLAWNALPFAKPEGTFREMCEEACVFLARSSHNDA